ncbi:MAG UNVERIFIED_CONTAM: UbiA family prenyltransferase [Anaerolineae bacterium]|jgi:4-hydroxybenzoate polyprenyltransferase
MLIAGLAAATFKASVYSMMQVHRIEDDTARGDRSVAVLHGRQVTLRFSQSMMVCACAFSVWCISLITNVPMILPILALIYFIVSRSSIWILDSWRLPTPVKMLIVCNA